MCLPLNFMRRTDLHVTANSTVVVNYWDEILSAAVITYSGTAGPAEQHS